MDADNRIQPLFLNKLFQKLEKNEAPLFTCWCKPDSNSWFEHGIALVANSIISFGNLIGLPSALGACVGCKTSIFQQSSGFNPEISFAEEYEFVSRLHRSGNAMQVFTSPTFTYSFRRFRAVGRARSLTTYIQLFLKRILHRSVAATEYPMGGQIHQISHYDKKKKPKNRTR